MIDKIRLESNLETELERNEYADKSGQAPNELSDDENSIAEILGASGVSRRDFIQLLGTAGISASFINPINKVNASSLYNPGILKRTEHSKELTLTVNGIDHVITVDNRRTLLEALREDLALTGTKKGCDHGQCGACTVIVDGERHLSCLTLAAKMEGKNVTSIEGIASGSTLHPVQQAFIDHDGFQCGFCTPGQICSAIALKTEVQRGDVSFVTEDVSLTDSSIDEREIKERMSGNLCRCSAYAGILSAVSETL